MDTVEVSIVDVRGLPIYRSVLDWLNAATAQPGQSVNVSELGNVNDSSRASELASLRQRKRRRLFLEAVVCAISSVDNGVSFGGRKQTGGGYGYSDAGSYTATIIVGP